VDALMAALKNNDEAALVAMAGEKYKGLVLSGDASERAGAAARLETFHQLEEQGEGRRVLLMGEWAWPMPIPLVRENGAWRFATEEGAREIENRRIGANERAALGVLRAYVEAQREYASEDRLGDGILQYAQHLASTPGRRDGLYWPADTAAGEVESPFGPLLAQEAAYVAGRRKGDPYRGYRFRILTRQGAHAPGGAYSYLIHGRMLAGFAMVAYPAEPGSSGVMTFIVNQNGRIYERNLGKDSARLGAKLAAFDPDAGWKEVAP